MTPDLAENHDTPRSRHLIALLALVPAPTLGVIMAMFIAPDAWYGKTSHALAKAWILVVPLIWLLWIQHGKPRLPRPKWPGMLAGLVTGLLTFATIIAAWELVARQWVDQALFAEKIQSIGLTTPAIYIAFAATLTLINALLEEYVWRWFVYERCRDALTGRLGKFAVPAAIALAAAAFTLHHSIAMSLYFNPLTNLLASTGVFLGGVTWSILYLRSKNIYAGYLSHIFADVALFWVGYQIAFGSG